MHDRIFHENDDIYVYTETVNCIRMARRMKKI